MFGSLLGRFEVVVRIVFLFSLALPAPAHAQSIVGTWTRPGLSVTFQADGRWTRYEDDAARLAHCGGPESGGGTYSAAAGSVSIVDEGGWCRTSYVHTPPDVLTGSYSISGNTVLVQLQGLREGPMDLILTTPGSADIFSTNPPSQPQSLIGTWTRPGLAVTIQADGRWTRYEDDAARLAHCGGAETGGGTYSAAAGSVSIVDEGGWCRFNYVHSPPDVGAGKWTIWGNTLLMQLQGFVEGPMDLILSTGSVPSTPPPATAPVITPTTPLLPPPAEQTDYAAPGGQLPAVAVEVAVEGTFGNATLSVTLDIAQALPATPAARFAADTYNVYVVALVPGAVLGSPTPLWFVKPRAPGNWSQLQFPIAAYLENVAQFAVDNRVVIDILTNTDISALVGTEIYVGYGTSDGEMLSANRYRGVYKAR